MTGNPKPDQLFTVSQIAAAIGVSTRRVRELIRLGKLEATNVGLGERQASYRISQAQLDAFLTARRVVA